MKKEYTEPEFAYLKVWIEDALAISNPRTPFEEQPSSGVDEGSDDDF